MYLFISVICNVSFPLFLDQYCWWSVNFVNLYEEQTLDYLNFLCFTSDFNFIDLCSLLTFIFI